MNDELIRLPGKLGMRVLEILKEKIGFVPRTNKVGLVEFLFTREELALIEKLVITNPSPGELEGIELLPNLRTLSIKTTYDTPYVNDHFIASIDDKDIARIAKCVSLDNLEIINQARISYVDVTDLKKLKYLCVSKNKILEEITGLETLTGLEEFDCVGNELLTRIHRLSDIIINNPQLTDLELDVLLFPDAIGHDPITGSVNEKAMAMLEKIRVSWQEVLNQIQTIKLNNYQMMMMHKQALLSLSEYVPPGSDIPSIVLGIELFLSENVSYDYDASKKGHTHSSNGIAEGPIFGANGAYNAFMHHTCVCEGYTRAMQYLLRLKGIKSHNVACISGKDDKHMSTGGAEGKYISFKLPDDGYHSIICIDDLDSLYDDPCWNAVRYQKGDKRMEWVLRTKKEISTDHTLSFEERRVNNNHSKASRKLVDIALGRIRLFREQRKKAIEDAMMVEQDGVKSK